MHVRRIAIVISGAFLLGVAAAVLYYGPFFKKGSEAGTAALSAPTPVPTPTPRPIVDFRMTDLEHGWIRYADGLAITQDGGVSWQAAASDNAADPASSGEPADEWLFEAPKLSAISYGADNYEVRRSQFITERVGWVLVTGGAGLKTPLLVTVDGGQTWHAEVNAEVREAIQAEKTRQINIRAEAALYDSQDVAKQAISAQWLLLHDTASPGDVVLLRSDKPGDVQWEGKTYPLQPFGAGYFTYLPISMQTKPGSYTVGGLTLTVKSKKFETQYLQVSQQMESMKQDTQRIEDDQKKIDAARSKSQPEFLFTSAFVLPIQGILTTPFGYTRYVNGKLDSSHTALDLAAKEGTPIKATNDGIVALADSLYLTGNSIYIDHGMGLFSQYAHLKELHVKTGDRVKKGDIIGLVGTTGFSTGPHLHFTFWAHNVPVNPNLFFDTTPFRWQPPKQ